MKKILSKKTTGIEVRYGLCLNAPKKGTTKEQLTKEAIVIIEGDRMLLNSKTCLEVADD